MLEKYCIDHNYISRTEFKECHQMSCLDECQNEVYQVADSILKKNNYMTVLDIGCGSAFKLIKFFKHQQFVGLEIDPNLSFLKEKYPFYDFRKSDFTHPMTESFDLIICSDVIEHLLDPDELLFFIKNISFKHLVISTPERTVLNEMLKRRGVAIQDLGPPFNPCLLYTSPSPRDVEESRMPSSA